MLLVGRKFGRTGSIFPPYFHYEIDTDVMSKMRRRILKARHICTGKNCKGRGQLAGLVILETSCSLICIFKNNLLSICYVLTLFQEVGIHQRTK